MILTTIFIRDTQRFGDDIQPFVHFITGDTKRRRHKNPVPSYKGEHAQFSDLCSNPVRTFRFGGFVILGCDRFFGFPVFNKFNGS